MRDFKLERFSRQMFIKSNQNCSQRTLKWKSDGRWSKYKFKKSYLQSWEDKPFAVWGFRSKALIVVVIQILFLWKPQYLSIMIVPGGRPSSAVVLPPRFTRWLPQLRSHLPARLYRVILWPVNNIVMMMLMLWRALLLLQWCLWQHKPCNWSLTFARLTEPWMKNLFWSE